MDFQWILIYLLCTSTKVHYGPSMMSQGRTPWDLYNFCGGISPEKIPQISIYSFWGVFPGEMSPQKLYRPLGIFTGGISLWHHWQSIEHISKGFITKFWLLLEWRFFFLRLKYPYTMGSITELAQAKMYKNFSTLISMCEKERLSATNLEKLQKKKKSF